MNATAALRTAYVSVETEADQTRRRNLYHASACIGFVWILFHFTVVFFFGLQLKSAILVGVFLGFGNLIALLLDVPVGILQRYFPPKRIYLFGVFSQLGAGLIFLKFIYASSLFGAAATGGGVIDYLGQFLDHASNLLLLFVAAALYGFTKEANDITTISYILNNSDPSEYSSIMSRNNIFSGGGALLGLLVSGFMLALNPTVAVVTLNAFILMLVAFVLTYFDSSTRSIELSDIQKLKVITQRESLEKIKEYAVGYVAKADFGKLAQEAKLIFLRPARVSEAKFDPKVLLPETKKEFLLVRKTISQAPLSFGLLWFVALILVFGFWDTFAAGFLVEYLAKLSTGDKLAYLLLGVMAIPAFVAQDPFIRLSKRLGRFPVALFGLALSGLSLFALSFVSAVPLVVLCGVCNSLGFAAGMGISQGGFLDLYNSEFAKKESLSEIDSNASAGPLKIVANLANVLGLVVGGLLLSCVGFSGFFAVFGIILMVLAAASFLKKGMVQV